MKTKQKEKADDIFQDVFIKLIRLRNRLNGEEHIRAWMIKTTLNCCRDLWKSAWIRHVVYEQRDVEACDVEAEVNNDIRIIVMGLPDKYRIIVHLYYYEEYSIKEISKTLKINQNTVCTRLARARKILKKEFENRGFHYEV
jgi:RNA polymerase sigma factor, sigma-70 family